MKGKGPFKRLVSEYRKIIRTSTDNQLLPWDIFVLMRPHFTGKRFQSLMTAFNYLSARERESAEFYYVAGLIYLQWAEWEELIGGDKLKRYKRAIEFFEKAIELKPRVFEFVHYLTVAYALQGNFKKSKTIFKKKLIPLYERITNKGENSKAILDHYPAIFHAARCIDTNYNFTLAMYYHSKDEREKAIEFLNKVIALDKYHCWSNWLLGKINKDNNRFGQASHYFRVCRMVEPMWAEPYYQQALIHCKQLRHWMASTFLCRARRLARMYYKSKFRHNRYDIEMMYYLASGMYHWQNDRIRNAYQYFSRASNFAKRNRIDVSPHVKIFPLLLQIDKMISKFPHSETLTDLKKSVRKTGNKFADVLDPGRYYIQKAGPEIDFVRLKFHFLCSLLSALDTAFRYKYIDYLRRHRHKNNQLSDAKQKEGMNIIIGHLAYYKTFALEIRFNRIVQALNCLENFILEIERDLVTFHYVERIPEPKQIKLIRSLAPFSEIIDGEVTSFHASQLLTKEVFRKEMIDFKSVFRDEAKQQSDILVEKMTEIIQEKYKVETVSNYDIEFKGRKVKVRLGTEDEPRKIFAGSRIQQPYQLLEYFIAKENHRVHWVEGIKIFKDWQKKRDNINHLKNIFSQAISDVKREFKNHKMPPITFSRPSLGFWELESEVYSNIAESSKLIKEIQTSLEKKDLGSVKQDAEKALEIYEENYVAAKLILGLKDEIEFDVPTINKARNILWRYKTLLEARIKPTLEYYRKHKKDIQWMRDIERIEFNQIENLSDEITYEIDELNRCLECLTEVHDEEYEEIKGLILEEKYDALLKNNSICRLTNRILKELRKRERYAFYGKIWRWFESYEDTVVRQYVEAWLCEAIEKNRQNIDFLIAWKKGILMNYLFKITLVETTNIIYQDVLQLPPNAIKDRNKAIKWITDITKENNGIMPARDVLRTLLCEKTGRPSEYSDYLLFLYDKGTEETLNEEIALDESGPWRESPQEKDMSKAEEGEDQE